MKVKQKQKLEKLRAKNVLTLSDYNYLELRRLEKIEREEYLAEIDNILEASTENMSIEGLRRFWKEYFEKKLEILSPQV